MMKTTLSWQFILALGLLLLQKNIVTASNNDTAADNPINEIAKGQFPFYVTLDGDYCAGALIHERAVLTTAYCVEGNRRVIAQAGYNNRSYTNKARSLGVCLPVEYTNKDKDGYTHNFAMLYLEEPLKESSQVGPIELNSGRNSTWHLDADCYAMGPGQLNATDGYVTQNKVKFIPCSVDKDESVLCFKSADKPVSSACQSDQGSPIVCEREGKQLLVGLTSSFIELGCSPSEPATVLEAASVRAFTQSIYAECVNQFNTLAD